ncbi:hypothetical protein PIB30_107373 [Stylosanthes scabra]|uniref:Putative plant transposon protein domain-containing protein n=1 Tax=Stylosanthes scabra TaxID=79078 RepID=A0ABU6YXX6_9FABA|nr:hypothetical protein [Stylosanthes scabra]
MASSSSVSVFDNYRFKTAFNEELYNTIVKNKKVIAECCINLDEDEYPEVHELIALRGWRRLLAPKQEISIDLIHEFYANAVVTEEEMEEHGGHTFRSFVRGVPIDFSLENIRIVMRVLADLCIPGATWKLSTGQLRVPIQLRRQELNPIAWGWHEFSIQSLIPSSNRSEIPVIRAILIHCIMRGEDVRAEDIIADKMVHMAQGINKKGKLGFPSTIYKLCTEAGVPLREFRRTKKIQVKKPITARRMESTRLPRPIQHWQQEDEDEDHPMPQPEYEHHQEFHEEPPVQQPPLYHVPTYTDQHEKDLHGIETQLQNMMWYQQQTLENISKSQAEYMTELREIKGKQQELYENNDRFYNQVRQEQREMAKEIQQVKNYQVNQTMVDSTRNKAILDELAAVKSRQEEFFSNHKCRGNMTRNASPRETYTVWAHQQANPNLVEMSSQKIVKQIYDNIDHKRPMFQGLLKSDLQPSNPVLPPSSSNDPKNPPK